MIRKHTRMSQRTSSDIIHTHEQMGGIGEAKIDDIIHTEKLIILLQMLNGEEKRRMIASGAIYRLQEYTKSNKNTLT